MKRVKKLVLSLLAAALIAVTPTAASADDPPEVYEFWLIDSDFDVRLHKLDDYASLRLPMLPGNLSIEAVANDATDSVLMSIDHAPSSSENLEPYALRGDASGDFNPAPELRVPGWMTISAQPFAGPDATGTAGSEAVLRLFLHQPDFVVKNPLDVGDFNPGDGFCSIGPLPFGTESLASVEVSKLPIGALKLRPDVAELAKVDRNQERRIGSVSGVISTIEVDPQKSSKATRAAAAKANKSAEAQIERLSTIRAANKIEPPKPIPAKIPELGELRPDRFDKHDTGGDASNSYQELDAFDAPLISDLGSGYRFEPDSPLDWYIPDWFPLAGCTLRAAVEEANALPGRQSILIDSAKGPFELSKGQVSINDGVDLIGHGHRAVVDAGGNSRIFYVTDDHIVNLGDLDLTQGQAGATGRGGAMWIDNDALVQMSNSVIRESQANYGGGVYLQRGGDLTLTSSAIRDNIAGTPEDGITGGGITQRGGGIYNLRGNVTIRHSSIFDNLAVRGGGLSNVGGTMRIENSSVIDNEALAIAGGIENHHTTERKGNLHLSFATVAHNEAGTSFAPPQSHRVGGGLYNTGWAYMASSIMADNTDGWSAGDPLHAPDCYSPDQYDFKSYRNNVVGVLNSNCDFGDYSWGTTAWIEHGTEGAPLDAHLGAKWVWDHRHYRMISSSSPALDGGSSQSASLYPCPDTDSRGRTRPIGAGCDIGSVERQ